MRTKSTRRLVRVLELSEGVLVAVAQPTGECLSRNAYLSPSCGTRLRTKRSRGEAVCPKIRTTCSPKVCGTGSRTNEGGARACSVRKSVPHRAAAHVVRVRGQTGPAGELFVQNPYHSPSCGTGLRINSLCAGLISKRRSPSDLRLITRLYACGSLLRCAMTSTTMPSIRSGILST